MNRNLILCVLAVLMLTATSFGQGFVTFPYESDQVLTTVCGGDIPIPDGTLFYLYHDANGNGPDLGDQLATLCQDPPLCSQGETGSLNFNHQPMNGEALGLGAGHFFPDYGFVSMGAVPTVNRFYIRVYYPSIDAPMEVWTSNVFSPAVGYSEFELGPWDCLTTVIPCDPTEAVTFNPQPTWGPQTQTACAQLCNGSVTEICVGPVPNPDRFPIVYVTGGCGDCDAAGAWELGEFVYTERPDGFYYCGNLAHVAGTAEGCVTIHLEFILPVEMGDVTVTPMDNSVKVAWNTRSETDLARFEVARNGVVVGIKEATNSTSGADYEFVDGGALNGHSYKYELAVVHADGSREVVNTTENVVPSFDRAVVTEYALRQNFPNPFNPTTNIAFDLVNAGFVTLKVYNPLGQEVASVVNGQMAAGRHVVSFDATNLPSGLYLYTLKADNGFSASMKMLLVK